MKSKQEKLNKAGTYLRLSKDDEKAGESLSIENQRLILQRYVKEQGFELVDEYVDDGYSGTTFDRPEVQRLLDDAKSGRINVIIVKDLSRFGRNYIEVGMYVDYVFPAHNIRFIALSDNVDTGDKNSSGVEMMPITNVFNEWHAANTSKKVRVVRAANAKAGKYQAAFAPYGYMAGKDEKRLPVIDEAAASVVRRIFELYASGLSGQQIATLLNEEKIEAPSDYRCRQLGIENRKKTCHYWIAGTVLQLLKNPIYLGTMVQMKYTTPSYKNKQFMIKDQSEWVVLENTHEPIISQELWDKCEERKKPYRRGKSTKRSGIDPLSGLMYCADCGGKMRLHWNTTHRRKTNTLVQYRHCYNCGAYSRIGKFYCSSHYIKFQDMHDLIVMDIREKAKLVMENEEQARENFLRKKESLTTKQKNADRQKLKKGKERLDELESLIQATYEDKVLKRVPEKICINLLEKYQEEKDGLEVEVAELEKTTATEEQNVMDVEEFIRRVKKYVDVQELTREMCLELIEYITVDKYADNENEARSIHVYYKFIDKEKAS